MALLRFGARDGELRDECVGEVIAALLQLTDADAFRPAWLWRGALWVVCPTRADAALTAASHLEG
jgi:hypothetical protein